MNLEKYQFKPRSSEESDTFNYLRSALPNEKDFILVMLFFAKASLNRVVTGDCNVLELYGCGLNGKTSFIQILSRAMECNSDNLIVSRGIDKFKGCEISKTPIIPVKSKNGNCKKYINNTRHIVHETNEKEYETDVYQTLSIESVSYTHLTLPTICSV